MKGQQVLEAGSGAGRFTEVLLSTGADVYSFDYSVAVEANWQNNRAAPNLTLLQGDILHIPFADRSFDKVLCLGVIQHTPDPEQSFFSLASKVRPGGELVLDVYAKSIPSLLQWKYLLRPITKRMDKARLHRSVERAVDLLLPLSIQLRRLLGRGGARLLPIVEYSWLGLPAELNRQWAILDTFDMYSPAFDRPQSLSTVHRWFVRAGFEQIDVRRGPNGVVAKGVRPVLTTG
jgi:SAM-dependent methyltransferase